MSENEESLPLRCSRPRFDIWSQKLKFKDSRLLQPFKETRPESVISDPEKSTESSDVLCEEMTSIQSSLTPGYSPKFRSCFPKYTNMRWAWRGIVTREKANDFTWMAQSRNASRDFKLNRWEHTSSSNICWLISLGRSENVVYLSMSCDCNKVETFRYRIKNKIKVTAWLV